MARPAGYWLNTWLYDDLLIIRKTTHTEVAATTGLSLGTLSDLRSWRRSASMVVARELAGALMVQPESLFPELAQQGRDAAIAGRPSRPSAMAKVGATTMAKVGAR